MDTAAATNVIAERRAVWRFSPLIVSALSVRVPPLATPRMRKLGADEARVMVAPLPWIVTVAVITGRPFARVVGATSV